MCPYVCMVVTMARATTAFSYLDPIITGFVEGSVRAEHALHAGLYDERRGKDEMR